MLLAKSISIPVRDYDLDATLTSGQVFNWQPDARGWLGVIRGRWVRLESSPAAISARVAVSQSDWTWLTEFLQTTVDLQTILASFPNDDLHLQAAVQSCRGLRLLRQDPWECLAAFILSSTKQITQIRQIVRLLCERYGAVVPVEAGFAPAFAFPTSARVAALSEADLRACKMGFRAPYLLQAARRVAGREIKLEALGAMPMTAAREQLMQLAGVGEKIADCVLLFAYGFPDAFPVDVWVRRVLTRYYFRNRPVRPDRLRRFVRDHFGGQSGYSQQYLFHHIRKTSGKVLSGASRAT